MSKMALDGVKVLEFATMVSGPYCGKLLGDMGAEVIKVELPGGDQSRAAGPFPKSGPDPVILLDRSGRQWWPQTPGWWRDCPVVAGRAERTNRILVQKLTDAHTPGILRP